MIQFTWGLFFSIQLIFGQQSDLKNYGYMKERCLDKLDYLSECELKGRDAPGNNLRVTPILDAGGSKLRQGLQNVGVLVKSAVDVVLYGIESVKMGSLKPCDSFNKSGVCQEDRALANGFKRLERIKLELDKVKSGLSVCQRVCLAKCISAKMISLDLANKTNFVTSSPLDVLGKGKGVCVQFTSFANLLASYMDAPVWDQAAIQTKHMVGGVNLNGKNYWYEPQSSRCEFFEMRSF